jgi:hypothetical protein
MREYKAEHVIVLTTVQSLGKNKSRNFPYKHGQVIFTVDKFVFNVLSKIMWLWYPVCIWQLDVPKFGPRTGYHEDISSSSKQIFGLTLN